MSLEEALKANTDALNRNNELLEFMTSAARNGLAAKGESPKAEPAKGEPSKAETTKPDAEEAAPTRRRRAAAPKPPKALSTKEMADATTKFLDVDDEDEYKARRELVKKIVDRLGVKKMSEIEEDDRQGALDKLEAFRAGDDPFEGEDDGGDEDDLA